MYKKYLVILLFVSVPVIAYNQSRTLDFYLDAGIHNSPLLKDFNNQINSALIDSLLIRSSQLPQVEGISQLLYSPAYRNFGYDEAVSNGGNYQGVISVTQNIFNKKILNNKFQSLAIQRQTADNESKISVADLKRVITEQYLAAYGDYNELIFNKSFLDFGYKENEIVSKLVSQGLCKQTDYLSLQIETQTQEILVNQLGSQFEKDLRQLNQLCGTNDPGLYQLTLPEIKITSSQDINNLPLFLKYRIDSIRIENEKTAIELKYKLKMNWFADAGFLTSTPWNFYQHFGYSAGVNLSIPVYDGHQKTREKQKLSLEENTRSGYRNNFRNQYDQQIQQLNSELKSLRLMTTQLEKQLTTSEQLVNALRAQLETGIIQMTEYINAVKNLRYINKNLSDNRIRIQQVINGLNYLLAQ
jgi:outer membrane protein TolC